MCVYIHITIQTLVAVIAPCTYESTIKKQNISVTSTHTFSWSSKSYIYWLNSYTDQSSRAGIVVLILAEVYVVTVVLARVVTVASVLHPLVPSAGVVIVLLVELAIATNTDQSSRLGLE